MVTAFFVIIPLNVKQMANKIEVLKQTELLGQQFDVYGTPQEPLFLARDVAEIIEHPNTSELIKLVDEDERLTSTILRSGQNREMWLLTENGLYEILMQSRKPIAKQFKKGVKAILKEIRANGGYIATRVDDSPELIMARALQVAQLTIDRHKQQLQIAEGTIQKQEEQIKVLAPKAEYTDKVLQATSTLTINQIAQELGMTAIRLNKVLEQKGIQYKQGKNWLLHAKYRESGYTKLRTYTTVNPETGEQKSYQNTVWTELGRKFIHSIVRA